MNDATCTSDLWIKRIVIVAAIAWLAGCGGGGGSSSSNTSTSPAPTTTTTTTTPPPVATGAIVNTYPASGRHIAPKIVFNGAGVGLAVWESADGPIYETNTIGRAIWYSLYQNGQWSPEAILAAVPDTDSNGGGTTGFFQLQAAASATGFAVVWIQQDQTNSATPSYYMTNLYARVFNGASWGNVTSVETGTAPVSQPAIASNGSGYLVAWEQFNATTSVDAINGNMYSGGAWRGVTEIANSTLASYTVGSPRVASNGSGYATAWSEFNGATYFNSARIFNGSWGTSQSFTGLTGFSGTPYLESSGGNYMLAWSQQGGASTAYDSIGSGTTWSAPAGVALPGLTGLKASGAGYAAVYPCTDPVTPADTSLCGKVYALGAWGSEVLLENVSGSNSSNPVLASDGTNYGVLWRQYNSATSDYNVYYNTFNATAAATPIQVAATKSALDGSAGITPPTAAPREAIAYDGTGYMLGWIQQTAATQREEVYAQHYSGATAGTMSMLLTLAHDAGAHGATLTVNKAGIKLAAWQQYYFDTTSGVPTYRYGLFAAATDATGAWGKPMLLSSYGNSAQVISNGSTFAIVYNSSTMYVAVRIYDPATATLSAQQNQSISIGYDPHIATNGTGYLLAWWETGTYPLYASIYNGTSWSAPASIGGANGYGIPQVASNGTGYAVAWQHYDSVTAANHAYANVFDGTTMTWLGSQLIDTQSTAMAAPIPSASTPHIAANGTGYALVWMQSNGTLNSIYASLFAGTSWSAPAIIDGQSAAALYPEVISNGTSYMAAWQQGTNCYARLWSGGSWQPLSNLGVCAGAITNTDSNLTMATDGVGYAFAFQTASNPSYGSYAAAYSNGAWSPITGVLAYGCGGPTAAPGSTGWVLRGGSGGYGVVGLCNGGLYRTFDLYGSFFHGSGWSTPAALENGAYPVGYGIDLAADSTSFDAVWTQPHESQPDPSTRKLYMRSGL